MKKFYFLLICVLYFSFNSRVSAQNLFLKAGDLTDKASQNDKYQDYAEIQSYQYGTSIPVNITTGTGSGTGKPTASEILVTKSVDPSSSKLLRRHLIGGAIPEIEIISVNNLGAIVHKIQLKDVYISQVSTSAASCGSGCPAAETYGLVYTAIKITTYTQSPTGVLIADTPVMFNFRTVTATY